MNRKTQILSISQVVVFTILFYLLILQGLLTNPAKLDNAFSGAKTYQYIAEIITRKVNLRLDETLKDNLISRALLSRASESLVTPEFVRNVSQKPIEATINLINKEGRIENNKVVVNTQNYKSKAISEINSWNLPKNPVQTATTAIGSIPDQITVLDLEENPNKFLTSLEDARSYLYWLKSFVLIFALVLGFLVGATVYINRKDVRVLLRTYAWFFSLTGLVLLVVSYLMPALVTSSYFIQNPLTTNGLTQNMVVDLANYILSSGGVTGFIFALIGLGLYFVSRESWYEKIKGWFKAKKKGNNGKTKLQSKKVL